MSQWEVWISEYGPPTRYMGWVEAKTCDEAFVQANKLFGKELEAASGEDWYQHYLLVMGQPDPPPPPPRPTVWSRLRNWEV